MAKKLMKIEVDGKAVPFVLAVLERWSRQLGWSLRITLSEA